MHAYFIIPILILKLPTITATAVSDGSNSTHTVTVGWVSDPYDRGTFSLIVSCLLTLSLCVWSAIHLNVPPPNRTRLKVWARTLQWVMIGICGSELVVFAAWRQYLSAHELQDRLKKLDDTEKAGGISVSSEYSARRWSLVHGFYAGMGGLTLESDVLYTAGLTTSRYLTLTARGVALLAECGHLPEVREEDIADKSKTDGIAKLLSCVQASWMLIQVCGRLAQGLPVTLLEINTLGHVLCAMVIYILRWHKPRQIFEPTKLSGEWTRPICAYMYMSSKISGSPSKKPGLLRGSWIEPKFSSMIYLPPFPVIDAERPPRETPIFGSFIKPARTRTINASTSSRPGLSQLLQAASSHLLRTPSSPDVPRTTPTATTPEDLPQPAHWSWAAEAIHRYPAIRQRTKPAQPESNDPVHTGLRIETEEFLVHSASNWPTDELLRGIRGLVMGMMIWFASMAFGVVHIAAWNDYFPSQAESWLWRSSALFIAASGLLWLVINRLANLFPVVDGYWNRVLKLKVGWVSYVVLGLVCGGCGVAYVTARLFLVVEAWISLRSLPIGAYKTPNWTQLLPHL